jgi:hypothetical protein
LESPVNIEAQKTGVEKYAKNGHFEQFLSGFSTAVRVTGIGANR